MNTEKEKALRSLMITVEKIISTVFTYETNPVCLDYFRAVPAFMVEAVPDTVKFKEQFKELLSGTEFTAALNNAGQQWAMRYSLLHPDAQIDVEELRGKITLFGIMLSCESVKASTLPDLAKIELLQRCIESMNRWRLGLELLTDTRHFDIAIENCITEIDIILAKYNQPEHQRPAHRILWQDDRKKLTAVIKELSDRDFSPKTSNIEKVLNGENVPLQIKPQKLQHFIWLIHCLHEKGYIKTTPRPGHFKVIENNLDWNFCHSNPKVSLKSIAFKINKDKSPSNPIKTVVSKILAHAKL